MYLRILFTVFQWSLLGFTIYLLTTVFTCTISILVHIIVNVKFPTTDAYNTQDISFLFTSLLGHILEDNLKLIGSGVEIDLQSDMLKRRKIFFK